MMLLIQIVRDNERLSEINKNNYEILLLSSIFLSTLEIFFVYFNKKKIEYYNWFIIF